MKRDTIFLAATPRTSGKRMNNGLCVTLLLLSALFSGCMKDKTYRTFTMHKPHYAVRQEVKDAAKLQEPQSLKDLGSFALYDNTMYITEKNKGIHVIDYSNPSNPVNKGFLPIPGNLGLSIRNNVLYADCFCELFVFKIISKDNIQFQSALANAFLSRMSTSQDTTFVQLRYTKKDTTVTEEYYNSYMSGVHSGSQMDQSFFST